MSFNRKKTVLIVLSMGIILGGVMFFTEKTDNVAPKPQVITKSTSKPSEILPKKETYHWQGDPADPKYITLSVIGAEGFIQRADLDQNQIVAPTNVFMAAWFVRSVQPGKPGLSIIDGHVNGRVNDGIFKNLDRLKNGDVFQVQLGNNSIKKFKVFDSKTVPTSESVNLLFSQDPNIPSQLNLITCAGTFNQSLHAYDKRLIVYSSLIN